jgi:hypothetical protein
MKRIIPLVVCLAVACVAGIWIAQRNQDVPPTAPIVAAAPAASEETPRPEPSRPKPAAIKRAQVAPVEPGEATDATPRSNVLVDSVPEETRQIQDAVAQLVSPKTSIDQKYKTWIKLRDSGKLPQVISELEQQATNNPTSAAYPAALGQAFIHQIATTKDPRQYALLGLKADQSFDAALEIDPKFWEARFYKAMSMSYWPADMNKGGEVVKRFTELIQDQEAQPAQPHFAQSYVWLGEQYQKTGQTKYADQVWRRGAALFPAEPMLQQKLAPAQ